MKRREIFFTVISSIIVLTLISSVSASPPEDRGHHRSSPRTGDRGMRGGSDYMDISGEIFIDDGITISLSITPTKEMVDRMKDRPDDAHGFDELSNTLNVTLYELVEYEDVNSDGYDSNDTVVSTYALNQNTLGDLIKNTENNITKYIVSTEDNVFSMIIEVNVTDNLPHDWKWSLIIQYPFVSSTSSIAMLHNIESSRENMIDPDNSQMHRGRPEDMRNRTGNDYRYTNNSLIADNPKLPIVFSWDSTAVVDDQKEIITATSFADNFALSLPQGEYIDYDPKVGLDIDDFVNVENDIASSFGDATVGLIAGSLGDVIAKPTYIALIITASLVALIIIITNKR